MITFRAGTHTVTPGRIVVEIWDTADSQTPSPRRPKDVLLGVIYPGNDGERAIRVVSKYLGGVHFEIQSDIPALKVFFPED